MNMLPQYNPWAGLASYEDPATSSRVLKFCGRDNDTYDVTKLIMSNMFVTLYGKSGIGKTSLLNAGVFPELRTESYTPFSIRLGIRDERDIQGYQVAIIDAVRNAVDRIEFLNIIPLQENQQSVDYLWKYFANHRFYDKSGNLTTPVVVFDQFEEIFRNNREEAEVLLRQLDSCAVKGTSYRYDINVRFVVSIREDDLYRLEDSIDNCYLPSLKRCRYRLRSLSEEGARDAILIPGKGLFMEEEQEQIANTIIQISGNKEERSISTNLLSLICNRLFEERGKNSSAYITKSLVESFVKDNPFERFYNEATRDLSDKEKLYIEEHLVDSTGRRNSIPESDFLDHIKNGRELLEGKNRILQRTSTLSGGKNYRIELIHDSFCEPIIELKNKRLQRRKVKTYAFAIGILLLCLGVISIILSQRETISQREHTLSELAELYHKQNTILEKKNEELKAKYQEVALEREAALQASNERKEAIDALQAANYSLDEKLELLVSANWSIKESRAHFVAEKANSVIDHDSYLARKLSLCILPQDLDDPDVPYVVEAERTLRNSSYSGITELCGHTMEVNSVEFSQDGKCLISASHDNTVLLWDSQTGKLLKSINAGRGPVRHASISYDNKKVISVTFDKILIYDLGSSQLIDSLEVKNAMAAAFEKGDENIIVVNSKYIERWDLTNKGMISRNELQSNSYYRSFHDRILISQKLSEVYFISKERGKNYVFDLHTGEYKYKYNSTGNSNMLMVEYSGDFQQAYIKDISEDNYIKKLPHGDVMWLGFSPNSDKLVGITLGDYSRTIILCDTGIESIYCGHTSSVNTAVFSRDGNSILSSSQDSTVCIWDVKSHKFTKRMRRGMRDRSEVACYYPGEDSIVSATMDGMVCIWKPLDGKPLDEGYVVTELKRHSDRVFDVHVSPNGSWLLSVSEDKSFTLGKANLEGGFTRVKFVDGNELTCAAFSHDSKEFVVAGIGYIYVYNTEQCKMITSFRAHSKEVKGVSQAFRIFSICYSPDNKYVLTSSSDNTAAVWNVSDGECIYTLRGHNGTVNSANYSPDGKHIVTASADGSIKIWRAEDGVEIASIKEHTDCVNYAEFSSDGKMIVSASDDNTIRVWPFPDLQQLIDDTREHFADSPLTPEERREYYLD